MVLASIISMHMRISLGKNQSYAIVVLWVNWYSGNAIKAIKLFSMFVHVMILCNNL